jgi:hypothetical protein
VLAFLAHAPQQQECQAVRPRGASLALRLAAGLAEPAAGEDAVVGGALSRRARLLGRRWDGAREALAEARRALIERVLRVLAHRPEVLHQPLEERLVRARLHDDREQADDARVVGRLRRIRDLGQAAAQIAMPRRCVLQPRVAQDVRGPHAAEAAGARIIRAPRAPRRVRAATHDGRLIRQRRARWLV